MSEVTNLSRVDFARPVVGPGARTLESISTKRHRVDELYLEDDLVVWTAKGVSHYIPLSNVTQMEVSAS